MRVIRPLEPGNFYHIYNRGINSSDIFIDIKNYPYFLTQYIKYCSPVLETYCYALLKNHFHLMVKVKENFVIKRNDGAGEIELKAEKQLSHFFNSNARAFNKAHNRHGGLFESPFRRLEIESNEHFTSLIGYIHLNPQAHGFTNNFKNWEFTSWHSLIGTDKTFLERD